MATSMVPLVTTNVRSSTRQRPGAAGLHEWRESPQARSPRTPTLGRSISHQLGSPGSFRVDQEDIVIYEIGARHFSAGFAGESQPRCILPFHPNGNRRVGDYRQYVNYQATEPTPRNESRNWGAEFALYKTDLRELDLGLIEDKFDRALRTAMTDFLQLDAKPRKAVLVLPTLLPTPLQEIILKVLFGHFTQPPSIALFTQPAMCCVGAGLRHGLVVDIGWEETIVAAVSEYKEIGQKRSVRAGKLLTREMASMLCDSTSSSEDQELSSMMPFDTAEDITQRMAWCRQRGNPNADSQTDTIVTLPIANATSAHARISFDRLAQPAERALFAPGNNLNDHDDNDLPIHLVAYQVLLSLPVDVRALCVSRIVVTGGVSNMPGLKHRFLQEVEYIIGERGWDPVFSRGSAKVSTGRALRERSLNNTLSTRDASPDFPMSLNKMPLQDATPHADRVHDDIKDPITAKVNSASIKDRVQPVQGMVRGVDTLGAWAGASLASALRIKGIHEVERENFFKHGFRGSGADI